MPLNTQAVQQLKTALRHDEFDGVKELRDSRISPLLGGDTSWLGESDDAFERNFGSWLSNGEAGELNRLAEASTDAGGVRELVTWFNGVLDGWAQEDDQQPAPTTGTAARFTDIAPVDGYPGWWQARDATDSADPWKYVRSTTTPTDATQGWLSQATAFATMTQQAQPTQPVQQAQPAKPVSPRFTNVTQVTGHSGWWQGLDTTAGADQWKYVRSTDSPTDATQGWVDQATAFAAMQQATAAPTTVAQETTAPKSGEMDDEDVRTFVDSVVGPAVTAALAEVEGVDELSPEDVYDALNQALSELSSNS